MGRMMGGGRVIAVTVALTLALTMASCGGETEPEATPAPPARTIAFLRAVVSGATENQAAFLDELSSLGYRKGENLTLLAEDQSVVHPDEAAATAAVEGWVAEGVDLIVALSTSGAAVAAKSAPDVPVAFLVNDPVAANLLENERAPEGHLTGVTFRVPADRTLDLARRAVPGAESFGVLHPPADPAISPLLEAANRAAGELGLTVVPAAFTGAGDVAPAVSSLRDRGAGVVWALNSPTTFRFIKEIAAATSDASLPLLTNSAAESAMLTLEPDVPQLYRQMANQVARLLGGASVRDIPVENPGRFRVTVNLSAASQAGVSLPEDLVAQADKVIP